MFNKKTKIVCTIGPASESKEILKELINSGLDIGTYTENTKNESDRAF